MRGPLIALCLLLALASAAAAGAARQPARPSPLRQAEELAGQKARVPPKVVVLSPSALRAKAVALADGDYPPAAQAYDEQLYRALGLLGPAEGLRAPLVRSIADGVEGVYDPARRTVYVARGKGQQAATVQQLVRAIQDQASGARKALDLGRSGRDAALAAAGATEGIAELFGRILPAARAKAAGAKAKKAAPKRTKQAAAPKRPIESFLALERGFAGTSGLRFAAILNNVGGAEVARTALRELPETTEQVFHMEPYLTHEPALPIELPADPDGYALVRDDTFGELDVRALLAVFQVPGMNAAAAGWGGGLSALYRGPAGDAVALRLDWDTEADARQWADAVAAYVRAAFGEATPADCAAEACWTAGGRPIGFVRVAERTALVLGPTVEDAAALATALVPAG